MIDEGSNPASSVMVAEKHGGGETDRLASNCLALPRSLNLLAGGFGGGE